MKGRFVLPSLRGEARLLGKLSTRLMGPISPLLQLPSADIHREQGGQGPGHVALSLLYFSTIKPWQDNKHRVHLNRWEKAYGPVRCSKKLCQPAGLVLYGGLSPEGYKDIILATAPVFLCRYTCSIGWWRGWHWRWRWCTWTDPPHNQYPFLKEEKNVFFYKFYSSMFIFVCQCTFDKNIQHP